MHKTSPETEIHEREWPDIRKTRHEENNDKWNKKNWNENDRFNSR